MFRPLPENPNDNLLEETWANATYAARRAANPVAMLREMRRELLDQDQGEPFAIAASPMRLTGLGNAANRSGFGPATCRRVLKYLNKFTVAPKATLIASELLLEFGDCPEQSSYVLRDIARRKQTTFFLKADDLSAVAANWLDGKQLSVMFVALPRAIRSKAAVTPVTWMRGGADSETVAAQYDKFVEVTEYAFGIFLPWLLRLVQSLAPFSSLNAASYNWSELATQFENSRLVDEATIDEQEA